MVHLGCPSCDRLISLPPDGRIPPRCSHCGQDLEAGELIVLPPPISPSAAMTPSDEALGKWNPAGPAHAPRGVESLRLEMTAEGVSACLPPYVSERDL